MADYIDLKHQKLGEGVCQKCGKSFSELNYATLSLGTKSKSYVLCNGCLAKLQSKAQSYNYENKVITPQKESKHITEDKKPVSESDLVTELKPQDYESVDTKESSINNIDETKCVSQDSNRENQNEYDLNDFAINSLLKVAQQKIAGMYQSVCSMGLKAIINQVVFMLSFIFCSKGSWRKFGTYPVDAEGNRIASIWWIVKEKKFGKRLIISAHVVDAKPYNDSVDTVSWRTCTLRKWLNEDFIEKAFSEEERSRIMTTSVENLNNSNEKESKDTSDKVFLLSKREFRQYFNYNGCSVTDYTKQKVVSLPLTNCGSGKTTNRYLVWLRSPGPSDVALATDDAGKNIEIRKWNIDLDTYEIDDKGFPVTYNAGIRPAMWISLF